MRVMPLFRRYGVGRTLVHRAATLCCIGVLMALVAAVPAQAADRLIWALGDSLTAGYGLPPADGFTSQLERALRAQDVAAHVANGGVSGDTTAQGRARLLWGLRGLRAKPDLAIVELGANDMLRGLPPAQARANLEVILAELKRRRIPTLIAGMRASPNLGVPYVRQFDAIFPALAAKYGARYYPFFLDGVAGNRALIQSDGLHPNAQGVRIIVQRMLPNVRRALGAPPAR
jgi:acyl-CoA thioesterase-1